MAAGSVASDTPIRVDGTIPEIPVITIDRPAKRNAMTLAMWRALDEITARRSAERQVRAIILTGGVGHFSAGADLAEFPQVRSTPEQAAIYEQAVDGAGHALGGSSKPVIAAI